MARTRVTLNSPGVRALLHSDATRQMLRERAAPVLARARGSAPFDAENTTEPHFRDSFVLIDDTTDRAVVRIASTDPKGAFKEAKSRTMTRALG